MPRRPGRPVLIRQSCRGRYGGLTGEAAPRRVTRELRNRTDLRGPEGGARRCPTSDQSRPPIRPWRTGVEIGTSQRRNTEVRLTHRWRGESAANSSRKSNSRAAPQWVDSTGIGNDSWCRKSGTGNNRAKTQHFRHFWMSISRLSNARARARERQVFRARAESPNAAGGTSGLTDPLLKSKNYSRKLCG